MALTDKYRPTRFEDVVGQSHIIKSLERVLNDERAKAFIFEGPSGCGKTTIARILANKFAGGQAAITNLTERDGAFASGAESVRLLVSSLSYRAIGTSPVKAVILDECHKLSNTAWSVLLKPLEEPPEHVYWMLCTTEPGKIPKTIQTRCQKYTLKAVSEDDILELLCRVIEGEGFKVPDEVIEVVADSAGGSPRQAINLLEMCLHCRNANEARVLTRTAGENKQVIDLCRFVLNPRGGWTEAVKLVKALEGSEPEGIRIVVLNYLAAVAMGAKSDNSAVGVLMKMEHFATPYNSSEKLAPLLLSIGAAINIGG